MMTPTQFAADYITKWEGGLSTDPDDAGNWSTGVQGQGTLLGSNHGVTGQTLTRYRGKPVTANDIKNLTLGEAVLIALKFYYVEPGFDKLVWNHVTASIMDFGWTSGQGTAVRKLQTLVGVAADGKIGNATATAYAAKLATMGEVGMADAWLAVRVKYYTDVVAAKPKNAKYFDGWKNRAGYFSPYSSSGWWKRFG